MFVIKRLLRFIKNQKTIHGVEVSEWLLKR